MGTDYAAYIHSPAWQAKRHERLALDGGRCVVCGRRAVNVHHLTYERLGAEDARYDLVSVCRRCHELLDAIEKAERHERRSTKQGGRMSKPGSFRGWLDWRVVLLLAVVTAILLTFVVVGEVGAAALDSRPTVGQSLPRGWRVTRPLQAGTVRGSISLPNRAPRGR